MDSKKVHPGPFLMVLMRKRCGPVSSGCGDCWLMPGFLRRQAPQSLSSPDQWLRSQEQHVRRIRPGGEHRWRDVNTSGYISYLYGIIHWFPKRYLTFDSPASVLLLGSILLVCEALRFPGDGSPDVTNDYDVADNRIDDNVPAELKMATRIDVRDTQQLRGEMLQLLAFVLKWMSWGDLAYRDFVN